MKRILAALLAAVVLPAAAQATITIRINQVGTSVVLAGTGSFDTTGLSLYDPMQPHQSSPVINAASGVIQVGTSAPIEIYTGLSGPVLGYLQSVKTASSATGDAFGLSRYLGAVYVPTGYQSGAALAGTSTYLNATFTSLGLRAGDYVFRSGADSINVNIGTAAAAVPEAATWAMMLMGFGAIGSTMRSARRRTVLRQG